MMTAEVGEWYRIEYPSTPTINFEGKLTRFGLYTGVYTFSTKSGQYREVLPNTVTITPLVTPELGEWYRVTLKNNTDEFVGKAVATRIDIPNTIRFEVAKGYFRTVPREWVKRLTPLEGFYET